MNLTSVIITSLRNDYSINLNLSDQVCDFGEKMAIDVYKIKKESMFYL